MKNVCYLAGLTLFGLNMFGCKKEAAVSATAAATVMQQSPKLVVNSTGSNLYIDFENATLNADYSLTDSSITYAFITKGTYFNPLLTTAEAYKGSTSIVYQMPHTCSIWYSY